MPMKPTTPCEQKDLFGTVASGQGPLLLVLRKIPAPRTIRQKEKRQGPAPPAHFHIPSFKNAKQWITKLPNGKPLKRPFLITSPEFQRWMEKAVLSLESQLLSKYLTGSDGTPQARLKLFAMLSLLPADDSVTDLPEGSWKVVHVPPGEEGAEILIERL